MHRELPPELRRIASLAVFGALLLTALCIPAGGPASASSEPMAREPSTSLTTLDRYETRLLASINVARLAAGLHPVRGQRACLDRYAERWARHLAATGDFVHRNQRTILRGCDLAWVGEALARGSGAGPADVVTAWLHSPSHRAVIMKPRANRAGVGVRRDDSGRLVIVLNFADNQ